MKRGIISFISIILLGMVLSACALNSSSSKETSESKSKKVDNAAGVVSTESKKYEATDLSALPDKAKARKDTFIAGISAPGGVFLPYFYENGWDGNATDPIFAPLVNLDEEGKPVGIFS